MLHTREKDWIYTHIERERERCAKKEKETIDAMSSNVNKVVERKICKLSIGLNQRMLVVVRSEKTMGEGGNGMMKCITIMNLFCFNSYRNHYCFIS